MDGMTVILTGGQTEGRTDKTVTSLSHDKSRQTDRQKRVRQTDSWADRQAG
jgi:hypothetical protein